MTEQTTEQLYCCTSCKYFYGGDYCNVHSDCNLCKMQNENGNCICLGQSGYNCPYYEEVQYMIVKIKSKRTVLKGIKQGKYNCISPQMIDMHCGKIAKVVDEHPYSYEVKFDDEELDVTWYWPKWCCKMIGGKL